MNTWEMVYLVTLLSFCWLDHKFSILCVRSFAVSIFETYCNLENNSGNVGRSNES